MKQKLKKKIALQIFFLKEIVQKRIVNWQLFGEGQFWGKIHPPHGASHPKNTRFRSICLPNVPGRMYTPKIKRIRSHFLTVEMPNFMSRILVFSFMFFLVSFRFAVYGYWWWLTVISETKRNKNFKKKIALKNLFFS